MRKNVFEIVQIHAIYLIEVKILIAKPDKQSVSPDSFRALTEDRAQAVRACHERLERRIIAEHKS
jgi:hypothetical protein